MTWVIGIAGFRSGAIAAADVQVTCREGRRECYSPVGVQKLYEVAPHVVVGFSGSVHIGFDAVASARRRWRRVPAGHAVWPRELAWHLGRRMRRAWPRYQAAERQLGCSLMVIGWSPEPVESPEPPESARMIRLPDGSQVVHPDDVPEPPPVRTRLFVLNAHEGFEVEESPPLTITAIGDGARVEAWNHELVVELENVLSGANPPGLPYPFMASISFSEAIERAIQAVSIPTVSAFMHHVQVGAAGVVRRDANPARPLARSLAEFEELSRRSNIRPQWARASLRLRTPALRSSRIGAARAS